MRKLLAMILVLVTGTSEAQGILKSHVVGDDTLVITLTVRNFDRWDSPIRHDFRVGTATYMTAGDHLVRYSVGDSILHQEWMHVTDRRHSQRWIANKWIYVYPPRLTEVELIRKK